MEKPDPLSDELHASPAPGLMALARSALPGDWESLATIQKVMTQAGHRVVLVGGAVRNLVLGKKPSDLDLASSARPEEVMRLFRHVIPTGVEHGTVTVMMKKTGFEITTFRLDGAYTDSRRPDSVEFTHDLLEDLKRRDFTVNAMALDLEKGWLIDPHGGCKALADRIITTVGSPGERFGEDALRIVRGIRFACQLGFTIEPATLQAMKSLGPTLQGVSVERFVVELKKTLASSRARQGLELMKDCGILAVFMPELANLAAGDWQSTLAGLEALSFIQEVRPTGEAPEGTMGLPVFSPEDQTDLGLMNLLRFVEPAARREQCFKRLKLSRREMGLISGAGRLCRAPWPEAPGAPGWQDPDWRRFLAAARDLDEAVLAALLAVYPLADAWQSQAPDHATRIPAAVENLLGRIKSVLAEKPALSIGELKIRGEDLQRIGVPKSSLMGRILAGLLERVLENPALNTPEDLQGMARKLFESLEDEENHGA